MNASRVPNIILVGPRCTGKTTTGRFLAARLGWNFVDADIHLESVAGKSIADIFECEGEAGFREREGATLSELCAHEQTVIATGGGAVLRETNRQLMLARGFVVWLTASPATLWARMNNDPLTAARRPNLTATGGEAEVRKILITREPLYREVAHFTVETSRMSPEAVAAAIFTAWNGGSISPSSSGASSPSSPD